MGDPGEERVEPRWSPLGGAAGGHHGGASPAALKASRQAGEVLGTYEVAQDIEELGDGALLRVTPPYQAIEPVLGGVVRGVRWYDLECPPTGPDGPRLPLSWDLKGARHSQSVPRVVEPTPMTIDFLTPWGALTPLARVCPLTIWEREMVDLSCIPW